MAKKAAKTRAPKVQERKLTIEDAISEAYSELQSLGEEMREAFDNTPESLQDSGVGEARGQAADDLENLNEPDVPIELQGEKFMVTFNVRVLSPSAMRKQSRSDRRYEAVNTLVQVVSRLEEIKDDEALSEKEQEAANDFIDEVQQLIDDAENVEFPGMYG